MAADHVFKQGDTAPALLDTLTYTPGGTPVDLTGCTVQLVMRALSSPSPLTLTGAVSVTNPQAGAVQYVPSSQDTATAGLYMANWMVRFSSGQVMTFPTVGYLAISIEENLVTAGGQQLVSLPDVKEYLSVQGNDRVLDAKLVRFIEAARPVVEAITGPIIPARYEEHHDGGQTFIQIRRRPSTGYGTSPVFTLIACEEYRGSSRYPLAIVADPAQAGMYSVTADTLGMVTRRTSGGGVTAFPPMPQSVHVVYTAGQNKVPANVYEGTLELLRVNYQTTQATGRGRLAPTDAEDIGPPLGFYVPRRVRELLAPNRRAPSVA